MRIDDNGNSSQRPPAQGSFRDQLKKAHAKPAPHAQPKVPTKNAAKGAPAAKKPAVSTKSPPTQTGKAALHAQTLAKGQAQKTAVLHQSQKASATFDGKLVSRRAEAEGQRPELHRVAEKLAHLLSHEPPPRPVGPAASDPHPGNDSSDSSDSGNAQPSATSAPATAMHIDTPQPAQLPAPAARTEALTQQIEKWVAHAELLSKAEGPALSLNLSEGRASRIEVTRTGKGEVSLRLDARDGGDRRALQAQVGAIRAALAERGVTVRDVRVG